MPTDKERQYGPVASLHCSLLSEEQQQLFHWFTDKLMNHGALRYSSILQAVACQFPNTDYWSLVQAVKTIVEQPNFERDFQAIEARAAKTMSKPTES